MVGFVKSEALFKLKGIGYQLYLKHLIKYVFAFCTSALRFRNQDTGHRK